MEMMARDDQPSTLGGDRGVSRLSNHLSRVSNLESPLLSCDVKYDVITNPKCCDDWQQHKTKDYGDIQEYMDMWYQACKLDESDLTVVEYRL